MVRALRVLVFLAAAAAVGAHAADIRPLVKAGFDVGGDTIVTAVFTSGVVGGLDVKFKNALGAVLQADWRTTKRSP